MAETKVLKGINFPGLEGTYYIPEATAVEDENGYIEIKSYVSDTVEIENLDTTLTKEGFAADAKAVGDAHSDIRAEISQLFEEKANKSGLTLGVHTDGLVYIFVDGVPHGNGLDIKTDVVDGDVFGYVDDNNVIVLNGALAEGTYTIKYEMDDGSTVEIGNLVLDNNVYYSITNNLTNCTNSNNTVQMAEGGSYSATITAKSGYELKSIVVKMGGTDISSTAVSGGKINIASVTGNIVITAVAEEIVANYTNLFVASEATLNQRVNSSNVLKETPGHFVTGFIDVSGKTPFTENTKIYVKGATFDPIASGNYYTKVWSTKNASPSGYTDRYSSIMGSSLTQVDEGNGVISVSGSSLASTMASGVKYMVLILRISDTTITTADLQNIVITIDEPIA